MTTTAMWCPPKPPHPIRVRSTRLFSTLSPCTPNTVVPQSFSRTFVDGDSITRTVNFVIIKLDQSFIAWAGAADGMANTMHGISVATLGVGSTKRNSATTSLVTPVPIADLDEASCARMMRRTSQVVFFSSNFQSGEKDGEYRRFAEKVIIDNVQQHGT